MENYTYRFKFQPVNPDLKPFREQKDHVLATGKCILASEADMLPDKHQTHIAIRPLKSNKHSYAETAEQSRNKHRRKAKLARNQQRDLRN